MKKIAGIAVNVYRHSNYGDCTNGGITSKFDRIILVGEGIPEVFEVQEGQPYLLLERRKFGLHTVKVFDENDNYNETNKVAPRVYLSAIPVNFKDEGNKGKIGGMFGGNFVYTNDSRFPSDYPIPVHDRFETQEMYDALSR